MNWFKQLFSKIQQPSEIELKHWASCEWIEYQAWVFQHSFLSWYDWQQQHKIASKWCGKPLISIVTPVYNTDVEQLTACIRSVQAQTYMNWQWCLVDDGSSSAETLACLEELKNQKDKRILIQHLLENQGICIATNHAIDLAEGDYIAFLDHDDRLAPDALFHVAQQIQTTPQVDVIYTDRDMLSLQDKRFMHLLKPCWSPETLLSGNYLFHLMVYKKTLLNDLGGLRPEYEGSQDYDLILRASDKALNVQHIPKVLYHWRQHEKSIAGKQGAKSYTYIAGKRALIDTLKRRGWYGHVTENPSLWRGNYCLQLDNVGRSYQVIQLEHLDHYAQQINQAFETTQADYLVFVTMPHSDLSIEQLVNWLQIDKVGMVTGKIVDTETRLLHAGMVQRFKLSPLLVYAGFPETTAGYMAVTTMVRNVSAPHPACYALKRTCWEQLGGLNSEYQTVYGLVDFALRALQQNYRTVYNPYARFEVLDWWEIWENEEIQLFSQQWQTWLEAGDPHYHPALTLSLLDMGLKFGDN
ncbi:glycosyltransferase [Candidatus Albibeggiatoa sp. nov. BB20]|uniref:glycosyltransferase n=1 Tax=Candidatus Albibeggiatoa sp. nov. BB20 TaxID=3162723 RepID=UPI0033658EF6